MESTLSAPAQQPARVHLGRKDETSPPPRASVASSLERLFQRMKDASNIPRDKGPAAGHESPSESSRSLRRTSSSASLDTIRAASTRGIRRRIDQMGRKATGSKQHHATKNNRHSPSNTSRENSPELTPDSECSPGKKRTKNGRKALRRMQDKSDRGEEDISDITARLLQTAPTVAWALQPSLFSSLAEGTLSMASDPPSKEDEQHQQGFPTRNLKPGAHIDDEPESTCRLPQIATVGINDLSLIIRPYEPELTIWDGHNATHHVFKCHLFLRCTAQPFDILSLPDVRRIEIVCTTLPVARDYAFRPPQLLRTTYKGSRVDLPTSPTDKPAEIDPEGGIHVSKTWCAMMDGDGTWGWYAAAFVPVPNRLFAKIEYRRFVLVGRLWIGENVLEGALTFGMSMLFRRVDMK